MSLDNVFNVVPVEVNTDNPVVMQQGEPEDVDLEYARGNYYEIIEKTKAAMNTAIKIAAETENPRAVEVLGNLFKVSADINKQLVMMSKDREDAKAVRASRKGNNLAGGQQHPQINSQNTVVFTGTSVDLAKLLAEK